MSASVAAVYLSKWRDSSDTRRTYEACVRRLSDVLFATEDYEDEAAAWEKLRYEDVRGVAAELAEDDLQPSTINKHLSTLRGILEVAWRLGLIPDAEYKRIDLPSVRGKSLPAGRALSKDELAQLVNGLLMLEPMGAAMVAFMVGAGLRRVEVQRLKRGDYDRRRGKVTVRGKGQKMRKVPIAERFKPFVDKYVERVSGERSPLFLVSRRVISYAVERAQRVSKLEPLTPHDLRRTFGTHVSKKSGLKVAQRLLGHADVKTTMLYDIRGEEDEIDAVKDL